MIRHRYLCPNCGCVDETTNKVTALQCKQCNTFMEISESYVDDDTNPSHYKSHPSGIECITITEHFDFNVGNCIKYLWRAGLKGDAIEDLKKAKWYVDREIKRLEKK